MTTTSGQSAPALGTPLGGSAGSNDLLGSIVREHLERAAGAPKAQPVEKPPQEAATTSTGADPTEKPQTDLPTAPEEVQTVQKDFAKLFEPADATGNPAAEREETAEPGASRLDLNQGSLSAAELDALLSQEVETSSTTDEDEAPDAEKAMQDAEGVLEAELTQLMAGSMDGEDQAKAEAPQQKMPAVPDPVADAGNQGAAENVAVSAAATSAVEASVARATAVADAVATPAAEVPAADSPAAAKEADAVAKPEAQAVEPVASAATAATAAPGAQAAPVPAAAMPAAPAGMQMPPPVVIEAPDEEAEETASKVRGGFFKDLLLMGGQVLDLPFAWISDDNKNLIGLAAFLLFLGGAALKVIAWMIS